MAPPSFKPEFTLGHIIQLIALIGAVAGAYWKMEGDIDLMESRIDLVKAQLESQITANTARYRVLDGQLSREITLIREALDEIKVELRRTDDPRRQ